MHLPSEKRVRKLDFPQPGEKVALGEPNNGHPVFIGGASKRESQSLPGDE